MSAEPEPEQRDGRNGRDARVVVAHNLRRIRAHRGLGLSQLAARAHMSKGTLSKLESGLTNPTIETLDQLAVALDVPLAELVTAADAPLVEVVRAGGGLDLADSSLENARLVKVSSNGDVVVEIHDMTFAPGQRVHAATHGASSWEHVLVLEGTIAVGPLEAPVTLNTGDYACYSADRPHEWHNEGDVPARVWVTLIGASSRP